ncbi:MAG: hypothetical protein JRJ58_04555, partial [Deltaproteobacteria bacterium]|nr:hypothetical protein [Deltaproteobacteria bacterium]
MDVDYDDDRRDALRQRRALLVISCLLLPAALATVAWAETELIGGTASELQLHLCELALTSCPLGNGDYYVVPVGQDTAIDFFAFDDALNEACVDPGDGRTCTSVNSDIAFSGLPTGMVVAPAQPGDGCPENPESQGGCHRIVAWPDGPEPEQIGVHNVTATLRSRHAFCDDPQHLGGCPFMTYGPWEPSTDVQIHFVVHDLAIHSIEVTQAIQVEQTPEDLTVTLEDENYVTPVPLVADKPGAVRVHLKKVEQQTKATIEIWSSDPGEALDAADFLDEKTLTLSPLCNPEDRRSQTSKGPATCNSFNFIFDEGPIEGD